MSASRAHANGRPAQAVARQLSASRQDLGKYSAAAARGQTAEAPPDPHPEQGRGAVHRPKVECDHTPPPPSAATPAADAAGPSSITTTESLPAGGCTAPCAPPATSSSCSEAPVARHGDALAATGTKVKLRYASCVCAGTQSTRVRARARRKHTDSVVVERKRRDRSISAGDGRHVMARCCHAAASRGRRVLFRPAAE